MKIKIQLISVFLCMIALLSGCSDNQKNDVKNDNKISINYWQHSSQARDKVITEVTEKFMKHNPDIKINLEFIPELDYTTKLISALAAGSGPDVFQVQSGMIKKLAKNNSIKPLNENIITADSIEKDFVLSTIEALKYNGKYYGLPTDVQTIVLYWNKKLLREAGLDAEKGPQTWDEMKSWAIKLTKFNNKNMIQSGWGEKGYNPEVQALIAQYGGKVVNEKGEFIFANDPKSIEAITFLLNICRKDNVYNLRFLRTWAGFRVDKIALMLGHPAIYGNLKTTAPNLELGVGLIPAHNGKRTTAVSSWAYVAASKSNSEAATKFIKYLTSSEVQKKWTLETGELPSRKQLLQDTELKSNPIIEIMLKSLDDSVVSHMQLPSLNTTWSNGYDKLMLQNDSIEKIMLETQKQMNEELNKN